MAHRMSTRLIVFAFLTIAPVSVSAGEPGLPDKPLDEVERLLRAPRGYVKISPFQKVSLLGDAARIAAVAWLLESEAPEDYPEDAWQRLALTTEKAIPVLLEHVARGGPRSRECLATVAETGWGDMSLVPLFRAASRGVDVSLLPAYVAAVNSAWDEACRGRNLLLGFPAEPRAMAALAREAIEWASSAASRNRDDIDIVRLGRAATLIASKDENDRWEALAFLLTRPGCDVRPFHGVLRKRLEKVEKSPELARTAWLEALFVLFARNAGPRDLDLLMLPLRSRSADSGNPDVWCTLREVAASAIMKIGPPALAPLLDVLSEPVPPSKIEKDTYAEYRISLVRYLFHAIFGSLAEPEKVAFIERSGLSAKRREQLFHEGHLSPAPAGPIGETIWRGRGVVARRTRTVIELGRPDHATAIAYSAPARQLAVLTENGLLFTLAEGEDHTFFAKSVRHLPLLFARHAPPDSNIPEEFKNLAMSADGSRIAVGCSSCGGAEELTGWLFVFDRAGRDPLCLESVPVSWMEEMDLSPDGRHGAILDYWDYVLWFDLDPSGRSLQVTDEVFACSCCQRAGTPLPDGETYLLSCHHCGLFAADRFGNRAHVFQQGLQEHHGLSQALPDGSVLVMKMDREDPAGVIWRLDGRTGRTRWMTHTLPGAAVAACERFWASAGGRDIVIGRMSDGAVVGLLPLSPDGSAALSFDTDQNRLMRWSAAGTDLVAAARAVADAVGDEEAGPSTRCAIVHFCLSPEAEELDRHRPTGVDAGNPGGITLREFLARVRGKSMEETLYDPLPPALGRSALPALEEIGRALSQRVAEFVNLSEAFAGRADADGFEIELYELRRRIEALANMASSTGPESVPCLLPLLDVADPDIKTAALDGLAPWRPWFPAASTRRLNPLLLSSHLHVQMKAAEILAGWPRGAAERQQALTSTILLLEDEELEEYRYWLDRLGETDLPCLFAALAAGSSLAGEHILRLTQDDDPDVSRWQGALHAAAPEGRAQAARALGKLGARAAPVVPALARRLSDPVAAVRLAAVKALSRIGPAARAALPRLRECLKESDADPLRSVLEALGAIQIESALPHLMDGLRSQDAGVRRGAALALARESNGRPAAELILSLSDADPFVRYYAASALESAKRDITPALLHALRDTDEFASHRATPILQEVGDLDGIAKALASLPPGPRGTAIVILGRSEIEGAVLETLLEPFEKDGDAFVRACASSVLDRDGGR